MTFVVSSRKRARVPCPCSRVLLRTLGVLVAPLPVPIVQALENHIRKRGVKLSKNIFDLFNEQNPKAEQRAVDEKIVPREPESESEKIVEKTEPKTEDKTEPETVPTPEPKSDPVPTEVKESEVKENVI